MKKKRIIVGLILILFSSCQGKENVAVIKGNPLFEQKMEIIKNLDFNNAYLSKTGSKHSKEFHQHSDVLEKMERLLRRVNDKREEYVDFREFHPFFKNQKYYKVDFWKKETLTIDEAILLIENLHIEIGRSELCNDLYVYEDVKIVCEEKEKGVLTLKAIPVNPGYKDFFVLSTEDSLIHKDAMKNKIIEGNVIQRNSNAKFVEGGFLVRKINSSELKYFKHYWR